MLILKIKTIALLINVYSKCGTSEYIYATAINFCPHKTNVTVTCWNTHGWAIADLEERGACRIVTE